MYKAFGMRCLKVLLKMLHNRSKCEKTTATNWNDPLDEMHMAQPLELVFSDLSLPLTTKKL